MRINIPWLEPHFDSLRRFGGILRKYYALTITLCFIGFLGIPLLFFIIMHNRINSPLLLQSSSPESIILYTKMVVQITAMEYLVAVISIMGIVIWGFLVLLFWIFVRLLVELLYQLFFPANKNNSLRYRRYLRFIYRTVGKRQKYIVIPFLIISFGVCLKQEIWNFTFTQYAALIGQIILILIPIVYSINWYQYLKIRSKCPKKLKSKFSDFLFSQYSIRRRFKNIIDGLVFFAILGWWVIPAYLCSIDKIANKGGIILNTSFDYQRKWLSLEQQNFLNQETNNKKIWRPPSGDELQKYLYPYTDLGQGQPIEEALPIFQGYLFFAVTLAGLFEIGFPVIAYMTLNQGYRKAILRVLLLTVKTMILVTILQFIVQKAYFINISGPLGIGVMFTFLMSFFFTQDAAAAKKLKSKKQ